MKKYLFKVTIFTTPIFIFVIILESYLRTIPNEFSFKKQYLDENSNDIETLILGNSLTYFGVNPDYFSSKCFNAANTGRHIIYDFKVFYKYQDNFKNLKNIIIPIAFNSLNRSNTGDKKFSPWGTFNYKIYFGIPSEFSFKNNFEVLSLPLPNIRRKIYRYRQKTLKNESNYGWSDLGWGNYYKSSYNGNIDKRALNAKEEIYNSINFSSNTKKLYQFIELLKDRNINIVFVSPPFSKTFLNNVNPQLIKRTNSVMKDITTQYDYCFYYDLSSDIAFQLEDFYDSNHLNVKGAKKLSLILNEFANSKNTNLHYTNNN